MRTITLELLRHGPPHNQLLSPLTPYLALCENHAAVTVYVPFEHNQFLHRLRSLGYKLERESREFQIKDTARMLGELLARIPGLTAELGRAPAEGEKLTHLRLIISASELALLPFELALAPNGFPGAGQPLLLQSQAPLCLTREIRRVPEELVRWPPRPRILFAAAAPPGAGSIPVESHLLALRRVIDPWVKHRESDDAAERRKPVEEHLVFLPNASARAIEDACASGGFTHVHILAHGVEIKDSYDTRYGLALHDPLDPRGDTDRVDGARLATILRASKEDDAASLTKPAVVTIASCNSGTVGSVAGAGASLAHALHEAGIPMVVAGQFPLSFPGSVRLVEVLYEGLLWGKDPRLLLNDLRRRLYSENPATHDWASLTAYASLPPAFELQLSAVQINRAMRNINVAMDLADEATKRFSTRFTSRSQRSAAPQTDSDNEQLLERAQVRINDAKQKLAALRGTVVAQRSRISGLLASTEKRQAEILYSTTKISNISDVRKAQNRESSVRSLEKARDYYWDAFRHDRSGSWGVVQYLSLTLVLQKEAPPERKLQDLWTLAHVLSLNDHHSEDLSQKVGALSNLVELYLLSSLTISGPGHSLTEDEKRAEEVRLEEEKRRALEYTRDLVAVAGADSNEVYSTRRQILRYLEWFAEQSDRVKQINALAEAIFMTLPEGIDIQWPD